MDIVNPSYPRGNKFYKVEGNNADKCARIFTLATFNAAKHLTLNTETYNETLGCSHISSWLSSLEISGEHLEFPKFKIYSSWAFQGVHESINSVLVHRKSYYQSISRIRDLGNMPWKEGMEIQWDNVRKGFIVFDVPYEGDLVTVPKSGISKAITEILKDIVAEAGMFELLGESTYVEAYYNDSVYVDKVFREAFEALLEGTQTHKQTTDIAIGSGAYMTQYDSDEASRLHKVFRTTTGNSHGYSPNSRYYKLVRNGSNKPKISTVTRTALMYKYGGYKLPDDHMDWFDG